MHWSRMPTSIRRNDVIRALSFAIDLIDSGLGSHNQEVARIAGALASQIGLTQTACRDVMLAAMLHDIGRLHVRVPLTDNGRMHRREAKIHSHAQVGAEFLLGYPPLAFAAELVRHHHVPWRHGGGQTHLGRPVPLGAHVIHLADYIHESLVEAMRPLAARDGIVQDVVGRSGMIFHPGLVQGFERLATREAFWLEVGLPAQAPGPLDIDGDERLHVEDGSLLDCARLFARLIDMRSRFTATHSAGVACVAAWLAHRAGLSEREVAQLRVAGYLHDVGKLVTPLEILEKPGALSAQEMLHMREHTFFTYQILARIPGLGPIVHWAADHHETLDGRGYPFQLKADELSLGARIMAVADIFTALSERRPYRKAAKPDQVEAILSGAVANCKIDRAVVAMLVEDMPRALAALHRAQAEALDDYESFWRQVEQADVSLNEAAVAAGR